MSTQTETMGPNTQLEEAEIRLQEVRHRIGAGDPDVIPDDLERAESALRFAHMRIEAARELEQKQIEQARQDRIAEVRASIPEAYGTTKLDKAFKTLVSALDAYCDEAQALQGRVSALYTEIAGIPKSGIRVETSAWTGATIEGHRAPNYGQQVFNAVSNAFTQRRLSWDFVPKTFRR